jgi:hypothetical protein
VEGRVAHHLADLADVGRAERLRRRLPGGAAERRTGLAHERVQVAHHRLDIELAGHVAGLDSGDVLVALVLGLLQPAAGIEPERAQRAALALVLGQRAVGLGHLGLRLLVIDVLELDEGAVPGGEEPRRDGLAAAVGADLEVDVDRGELVLVGPERAGGGDPHWLVEGRATLQLDRRVELQVRAPHRRAERLVEQALDVLRVIAATAGSKRQRGEEQAGERSTHPAQTSWATATRCNPGRWVTRWGT